MNSPWACIVLLLILQSISTAVNARCVDTNDNVNENARIVTRSANCDRFLLGREVDLPSLQPNTGSRLQTHRFSRHEVEGILQQFLLLVNDMLDIVRPVKDAWSTVDGYMPVTNTGLRELNPTDLNTTHLTNAAANDMNIVLREMRWLHTAIDASIRLVKHAGQLGPNIGRNLVSHTTRLSNIIDHMLRVFGVQYEDLPDEANCRETTVLTVDSIGVRIFFTSVVLKDVHNALERIEDVVSQCQVRRGNPSSRHGFHLQCSHSSLFYSSQSFNNDGSNAFMFPLEHFID